MPKVPHVSIFVKAICCAKIKDASPVAEIDERKRVPYTQEDVRSFHKRNVSPGARKKHKAMRPKTSAKKKPKGRKVVIGKDLGTIITGKSPGITKAGATIRQSYHSDPSVSAANRLWIGGNSISDERFLLDLAVEGMVEHLLRRAGDTRSTKTQAYGTSPEMIFHELQMVFCKTSYYY